MKSETKSDSEWMPSAINPCDFEASPTPTYVVASRIFTTTLTHVLRAAAAER